ncbi:MAG: branched-chain amino acid transport system II carrier protein [Chlamydiia bacterium]|nr:branched-chain amino acid transport system II carrier protein [Chlamydiia bacterium]
MRSYLDTQLLAMGLAIFSMFFGAGNAIFPLILGAESQSQFLWAFLGLAVTGIGMPLLGLCTATLFQGRCTDFFMRAGRIPAILLMAVTLGMLGPFAVLPRCITVAYAAVTPACSLSLGSFALLFGAVALLCSWKHHFVLPALGYVLSPLLVLCLVLIILQGVVSPEQLPASDMSRLEAFQSGFVTGYSTMDLVASLYFAAGIWGMVSLHLRGAPERVFSTTLKAGTLGCLLLGLMYLGLMHAAARYGPLLDGVPKSNMMAELALITLGPKLGMVANLAVALACLTTVISLAITITRIVCTEILPNRIEHRRMLTLMLVIATAMTNLGFEAIMEMIGPAMTVCYPVCILLTFANLASKLRSGVEPVHEAEVAVAVNA